jgi:hypothetical protein
VSAGKEPISKRLGTGGKKERRGRKKEITGFLKEVKKKRE